METKTVKEWLKGFPPMIREWGDRIDELGGEVQIYCLEVVFKHLATWCGNNYHLFDAVRKNPTPFEIWKLEEALLLSEFASYVENGAEISENFEKEYEKFRKGMARYFEWKELKFDSTLRCPFAESFLKRSQGEKFEFNQNKYDGTKLPRRVPLSLRKKAVSQDLS